MSEPASFVIIRDGEKRYYYDRWAHSFLYRNLIWGPEELDHWLRQEAADDEWDDDICGGVVVDFDQRLLVWDGDDDDLRVPRVAKVLHQLLETSWPGYRIEYAARGVADLARAAGETDSAGGMSRENVATISDEFFNDRPHTIREALGIYDDDADEMDDVDADEDDDFDEDEEDDYLDDDASRAWVTLINEQGAVRHRQLSELSQDIFSGSKEAIRSLLSMDAAEVPAEKMVREGIWFDFGKRQIGFWGSHTSKLSLPHLQRGWTNWDVSWAEGGYADQCGVSGPSGIPMSDEEALAKLTPKILSTKRIDMSTILGAMGSSIKKTAVKATGCLALLLSAPVLIFGLIAGKLQAAAITIAIVWVGLAIVFKVIEYRFKKKFTDGPMAGLTARDSDRDTRPPVAGSLDATSRSQQLDRILAASGFPSLAVVSRHIDEDDALEGLL